MKPVFDVFLSYRRDDGLNIAEVIYNYLTEKGLRVFFDKKEMIDGQYFSKQIKNNVTTAPCYLFIGTPLALRFRKEDDWVKEEIKLAMANYAGHESERIVLPLLAHGAEMPSVENLPEGASVLATVPNWIKISKMLPSEDELRQILKAVCKVTRHNLWNAGQRWLEYSRRERGRFHHLNIVDAIFPLTKQEVSPDQKFPINVHTKSVSDVKPLFNIIDSNDGHLYLIGEGGIGKTTSMVKIMRRSYDVDTFHEDNTKPIPLFIELSRAPLSYGKWYENSTSNFILYEIFRQLRSDRSIFQLGAAIVETPTVIENLRELLCCQTDKPQFLLLLDGLNEVATSIPTEAPKGFNCSIRLMINREITKVLEEFHNVRVILTSRTDDTEIRCDGDRYHIDKLTLAGLNKDTILSYLNEKDLSADAIERIKADENLLDCLRIPLFLTMFGSLHETEGISTCGEIFRQFFGERRPDSVYSQRNRAEDITIKTGKDRPLRRISVTEQCFVLDCILPRIARAMEQSGVFYIDKPTLRLLIEPMVSGDYYEEICNEYTEMLYTQFTLNESKNARSFRDARNILYKFGRNVNDISNTLVDCFILTVGVMQETDDKYSFIHHHIQDYFAAIKDIETIRFAVFLNEKSQNKLALKCLTPLIKHANHSQKSIFIGEILGEYHNAPILIDKNWQYNVPNGKNDRNLLKRALDILRGRFDKKIGYGVYNLIESIKNVRHDLSGADFTNLDLTFVSLNGIRLGHTSAEGSNFQGSKIRMENFLNLGHSDMLICMAISSDGKSFITGSRDNTIKEWDKALFKCVATYYGHTGWVVSVAYSPDNNKLLSGSFDKTVREWNRQTGKCIYTYKFNDFVNYVTFAPDGRSFFVGLSNGIIEEWDCSQKTCMHTYKKHKKEINTIVFDHSNSRLFLSCSEDKTIREWDRVSKKCLGTFKGHEAGVLRIVYSCDGKNVISFSEDNTIREWSRVTRKCAYIYDKKELGSLVCCFDGKGESFIICNENGFVYNYSILSHNCNYFYQINMMDIPILFNQDIMLTTDGKLIREYNSLTGKIINSFVNNFSEVTSMYYTTKGDSFIFAASDNTLKEWDSQTYICSRIYEGHSDWITGIVGLADDNTILSSSYDKTVKEWHRDSGKCVYTYTDYSAITTIALFQDNSSFFLAGTEYGIVKEWNRYSKQCIFSYDLGTFQITTIAINPANTNIIAIGLPDGSIQEWNRVNHKFIRQYKYDNKPITSVLFSSDGKSLFSSSENGNILRWDRNSNNRPYKFNNFGFSDASCIALSKDDHFLLGAEYGLYLEHYRIMDVETISGKERLIYKKGASFRQLFRELKKINSGAIDVRIWDKDIYKYNHNKISLSYSPDNKKIISGSYDGTIRVWSTETGKCLRVIQNYPGLIVLGCDMRKLHPDCSLSDEDKTILRQYGAIVD